YYSALTLRFRGCEPAVRSSLTRCSPTDADLCHGDAAQHDVSGFVAGVHVHLGVDGPVPVVLGIGQDLTDVPRVGTGFDVDIFPSPRLCVRSQVTVCVVEVLDRVLPGASVETGVRVEPAQLRVVGAFGQEHAMAQRIADLGGEHLGALGEAAMAIGQRRLGE